MSFHLISIPSVCGGVRFIRIGVGAYLREKLLEIFLFWRTTIAVTKKKPIFGKIVKTEEKLEIEKATPNQRSRKERRIGEKIY